MTKTKALEMMLKIVKTCQKQSEEAKGCRSCPFGCGANCLASNGNGIPSDWLISEKVYEWTKGE